MALVDDALDHTPAGGRVQLAVRCDRREVTLAVTDTGPGIEPAAATHLLRRFQSSGQRAGRAHYGLGLAWTHDVDGRHSGVLRLAPAPVGTTFELLLPLANPTGSSHKRPRTPGHRVITETQPRQP